MVSLNYKHILHKPPDSNSSCLCSYEVAMDAGQGQSAGDTVMIYIIYINGLPWY